MLSGGVSRIGTPRAPAAGGDSIAGAGSGADTVGGTGSDQLVMFGWRQVY